MRYLRTTTIIMSLAAANLACGESSSSSSATEDTASNDLVVERCATSELPEGSDLLLQVSGEINGVATELSCTADQAEYSTDHLPNIDPSIHSYQHVCDRQADTGHRLSAWIKGASLNEPFTTQLPYGEMNPTLTLKYESPEGTFEQDSFTIDTDNVLSLVGIITAYDQAAGTNADGKALHAAQGCIEGSFQATATKPGGWLKVEFRSQFVID